MVETLYESHGILPFGGAQDGKKVYSVSLLIIFLSLGIHTMLCEKFGAKLW